jgi:hypothetical protein
VAQKLHKDDLLNAFMLLLASWGFRDVDFHKTVKIHSLRNGKNAVKIREIYVSAIQISGIL